MDFRLSFKASRVGVCREECLKNDLCRLAEQARAPEMFACGIAKSGAYNRTLTPFGFQAEERTIWQAPEVYATMSPFLQVPSRALAWPGLVRSCS